MAYVVYIVMAHIVDRTLRFLAAYGHARSRLCTLYVGSISASPTACPLRGRAGTQNDRLGELFFCLLFFYGGSILE